MIIEKTIEELKEIKCLCCDYSIKDSLNECACTNREVLKIAIRSLEAWGKVKEEIETEIKAYDEIVTFHRGVRIGLKIAEEFIDKHLKEVENGT